MTQFVFAVLYSICLFSIFLRQSYSFSKLPFRFVPLQQKAALSALLDKSAVLDHLHVRHIPSSVWIAELDPETISALGDVQELNEALDSIDVGATTINPAADILTRIVASPLVLAIPIGAGVLVAVLLGFFIYSWGQVKET